MVGNLSIWIHRYSNHVYHTKPLLIFPFVVVPEIGHGCIQKSDTHIDIYRNQIIGIHICIYIYSHVPLYIRYISLIYTVYTCLACQRPLLWPTCPILVGSPQLAFEGSVAGPKIELSSGADITGTNWNWHTVDGTVDGRIPKQATWDV